MKHRYARSLVCLSLVAATAGFALNTQAQSVAQRSDSGNADAGYAAALPAPSAKVSTAAYSPESSRPGATAESTQGKRKPRWFDERRQLEESAAASGHFERLSYTRYEGEAEQDIGTCVYYQSSYTYSCR